MQEQERIANEEAEKRLKAALTAKREPTATSRVASPSLGNTTTPDALVEAKLRIEETSAQEDVTMEVENASATPPTPEVSPTSHYVMDKFSCANRVPGFLSSLLSSRIFKRLPREIHTTSLGKHQELECKNPIV